MTEEGITNKLERYKYAIMYYVYFATCLVVALWLSKPMEIISAIISSL